MFEVERTSSVIKGCNFLWREMFYSKTAKKHGLINEPNFESDEDVISNLQYLVKMCLQPVRERFGIPIIVHSAYRSSEVNKIVGGSSTSFHLFGCAADISFGRVDIPTLKEMFFYLHNNAPFTELIAEDFPDGWVHIAIQRGREEEKAVKYKFKGKSVTSSNIAEIMRLF